MPQTKEEFIEKNIEIKQLNNGDFYINSIRCDVRGHVGGDVRGHVRGHVFGDVFGDVFGNVRQKREQG